MNDSERAATYPELLKALDNGAVATTTLWNGVLHDQMTYIASAEDDGRYTIMHSYRRSGALWVYAPDEIEEALREVHDCAACWTIERAEPDEA
jgi:hypothetical protein